VLSAVLTSRAGTSFFPINRKEGVRWLEQSAAQGNADAQYALGLQYYLGVCACARARVRRACNDEMHPGADS
jgi:TPR repeat protein